MHEYHAVLTEHYTLCQLAHSHMLEMLVSLVDRRSWQCPLNPGSQTCEHKGPLAQQKTAANLSSAVPLNIPLAKRTVSNESQARNETRITSIPNYQNQIVLLKQQGKSNLKEPVFWASGNLWERYTDTVIQKRGGFVVGFVLVFLLLQCFSSKVTLSTFAKK